MMNEMKGVLWLGLEWWFSIGFGVGFRVGLRVGFSVAFEVGFKVGIYRWDFLEIII